MLSQIAAALHALHAAGYVHRDIRTGNIIWMPLERRWALIGFGHVARVDDVVPPRATLPYAPPEALRAQQAGARSMIVAPAVDTWALGLVALQVLGGAAAMPSMLEGPTKVRRGPQHAQRACCTDV